MPTEEEKLENRRRYQNRTPEQKAKYREKGDGWHARKAEEKRAAREALGIRPGCVIPTRSPEEILELQRITQKTWRENNLEHSRERERVRARRIAVKKALAEGKEIDLDLERPKMRLQTEEEKREKRRLKAIKWRANNLERAREIGRESAKKNAAERAIAEGREPGKIGVPKQFTEAEQRAKRRAKNAKWTANNLDTVRERSRVRESAKRAGTFVSKGRPRLTEEEKALVNRTMSANRRARLNAAEGTYTKEDVIRLREVQEGICLWCGDDLGDGPVHIDHWIPIIKNGPNTPNNLALLHQFCNTSKGAKLPSDFGLPDDLLQLRPPLDSPPVSETGD